LDAVLALSVLAACGAPGAPAASASAPKPAPGAQSEADAYFPLEDGKIYQYVTDEGGETGMQVMRVHRSDATHGELRLSNGAKRFVFTREGVAYDGGAYVLKAPLDAGASWPGEHGGTTRIARTDAAPKVAAGSYSSCVETIEEGGRPQGSRYTTTFCPGVGIVLLEVAALGATARAELKSYGFPVKIE
jgi:hypothetical protein